MQLALNNNMFCHRDDVFSSYVFSIYKSQLTIVASCDHMFKTTLSQTDDCNCIADVYSHIDDIILLYNCIIFMLQ